MSWRGGASAPDPFRLRQAANPLNNEPYNYAGRTLVSPNLSGGESTAVFLTFGDSLAANTDNATYTPTNATKVQNLSIENQGVYLAKDPILGCTDNAPASAYGNWGPRFADKMITAGHFQRIILVQINIGGSNSEDWANETVYGYRFGVAYRRLVAAGLGGVPTYIMSSLGGADNALGWNEARSTVAFNAVIAKIRAAGFTSTPVFLAKSSFFSLVGSAATRAAIAAATAGNANVFEGADTDTLGGANRYDTNHWNATGSNACADLWKAIFDAYL